ncbi:MAG: bifunctional nuclease family protein [Bacteroidales bacterium]|nr:bifunctional nuclease family protein [Bacteroidales bacterium]
MTYHPVFPDDILLQNFDSYSSYIMLLAEPVSNQQVPIVVGAFEAQAIIIAKENIAASRPLTHSLMATLMSEYGLSVRKVTIDRFLEGVFYATLWVTDGFGEKKIDCRPSDAIALALIEKSPIMISDDVLNEVGIEPYSLIEQQSTAEPSLEELEAELHRCEENEEYERAADILEQIRRIKG